MKNNRTSRASKTRAALPRETALLGFAGAPFTLACYMIEGGASEDYRNIKTLMLSPRKDEPQKPFALFGSLALSVGGEDLSSYAPSACWHCCGQSTAIHPNCACWHAVG